MIKLISWNIQQGGGSRVLEICTALIREKPHIICLNEFKNNEAGAQIRIRLLQAGYIHQQVGDATNKQNSVLTVSILPFHSLYFPNSDPEFNHCIIRSDFGAFSVYNMYLPHKKKHKLFDLVIDEMKTNPHGIFVGDFNSGKQFIDQEGSSFMYAEYFDEMELREYVDAWRLVHKDKKDYSWYSHQGNGYRYDHIYLHQNLDSVVNSCDYLHEWRQLKWSDHSPMQLELGN